MELKDALLYLVNNFAATLAALIVVAGTIRMIKPIGQSIKRFVFAELYAANDKQDKRLDNLEMQQLKQLVCDRRLPVEDRLNAGDEYIKRGGNGEIRVVYNDLQRWYSEKLAAERREV